MSSLREYEDYILVTASILAAVADTLGANPRYSLYALIIGAVAKGLMSIISRQRSGSPL
jgi:Na+/H+ antiporter NhaD/arsenite permease-like protein